MGPLHALTCSELSLCFLVRTTCQSREHLVSGNLDSERDLHYSAQQRFEVASRKAEEGHTSKAKRKRQVPRVRDPLPPFSDSQPPQQPITPPPPLVNDGEPNLHIRYASLAVVLTQVRLCAAPASFQASGWRDDTWCYDVVLDLL